MATTVRDPLAGRVLDGRYRIVDRIASGGMATVYQAIDTRLDRPVAVKVLHASWAADPQARARFQREARSAARLTHPDVVAVFDQGEDNGDPFLVMEYVPGATLREVLRARLRLSAGEAAAVMDHVLAALAAAHRIGLVHRDVKPENVLLTVDGRVKVADFGLARAVTDATVTTATAGLIGTAAYLAPEQWNGGPADARSDVYAAGVMLFELLTGSPPYAGEPPPVVMRRHLEDSVPPPSTLAPGIPPDLDRLVAWATQRDPRDRPTDAGELHSALLEAARRTGLTLTVPGIPATTTRPLAAVGSEVPTVTGPVRPGGGVGPTRRRRRWPWIAVLVLLLTAAAAVAGWWFAAGRYTNTPNLLGLTRNQALARLRQTGLHAQWLPARWSASTRSGRVAYENPGPGGQILGGGTVQLALSKGPRRVSVPSVAGEPRSQAVATLRRDGFSVHIAHEYSAQIPPHAAVGTSPPAGESVQAGTAVTLYISQGHAPVTVPDVAGEPLGAAQHTLGKAGFTTRTVQVYSDTVPQGRVVATDPAAGRAAAYGSTVTIDVSQGPRRYPVPDVTGESIDQAIRAVRHAGFTPDPKQIQPGGPGMVVRQDPAGGSAEPHGTTVTLYYY